MERLLLRAAPPAAAFTFVFGGGSAAAAAGSDLRRCALGGARRGCEATARSVRTPPGAAVPGAAVPGAPSGAAPRVIGAAVREIRFAPAGGAARAAALWHLGALRLLGPRPLRAVTVTFPVPFAPGGGGRRGAHRGRCGPGSPRGRGGGSRSPQSSVCFSHFRTEVSPRRATRSCRKYSGRCPPRRPKKGPTAFASPSSMTRRPSPRSESPKPSSS